MARSMTQNHDLQGCGDDIWLLMDNPRVHKALEKYVVVHTYIHTYTSKAGTRGAPLVLSL